MPTGRKSWLSSRRQRTFIRIRFLEFRWLVVPVRLHIRFSNTVSSAPRPAPCWLLRQRIAGTLRPTSAAQQKVSFTVRAIDQLAMLSWRLMLPADPCLERYVSRIHQSFNLSASEFAGLIAERNVMARKTLDWIWTCRE